MKKLIKDLLLKNGIVKFSYRCLYCSKKSNFNWLIKKHIELKHKNNETYKILHGGR